MNGWEKHRVIAVGDAENDFTRLRMADRVNVLVSTPLSVRLQQTLNVKWEVKGLLDRRSKR